MIVQIELPNQSYASYYATIIHIIAFWMGYNIPPYPLQANSDSFVVKTLDRKTLWEMQTPQVTILLPLSMFLVCVPVPTDQKTFGFFLRNHNIIIACFLTVGYEAQFTQRWF